MFIRTSERTATETRTACATHSALFTHPLLEDSPVALSPADRRSRAALAAEASALCATCPLRSRCLYDAVVRFDVAGIVAGTTPSLRAAIRARLDWHVAPENFDALLGLTTEHHVDHEQIVRARRVNPHESLEDLAERLGCSLSTVKRHLRQEREGARPSLHIVPPSPEQVDQARRDVLAERRLYPDRRLAKAA